MAIKVWVAGDEIKAADLNTIKTAVQNSEIVYAATTGSANAYVLTLAPAILGYIEGQTFKFKANFANTGAATLNVNDLGAKTIVKYVSIALIDGDIAAGMFCTVIYNGTNFVLQNPVLRILRSLVASDNLKASADTEVITSVTAYTLLKSIKLFYGGTIRVNFNGKVTGGTSYLRVYVNGVAVGTERAISATTYTAVPTQDFTVIFGDSVQIYGYEPSGGQNLYLNNFRISWDLGDTPLNYGIIKN